MIRVVETSVQYRYDDGMSYEIEIFEDGKRLGGVSFHDGENEDNTINRNFNDVLGIVRLLKIVHQLGKDGKELTFEKGTGDEE